MHAVFAFARRNVRTQASNIVETPHSPVFSLVTFEKSEMLSFGSLMGVVSPSAEVILSRTCGVCGIGRVAKLPAARAGVRLTGAFSSGTVRQGRCRRQGREGGLEVTVREQQGRRMEKVRMEKVRMERCDMRTANTLSHACTRCLYATQGKGVRKMCVRHGVCVHPASHTQ